MIDSSRRSILTAGALWGAILLWQIGVVGKFTGGLADVTAELKREAVQGWEKYVRLQSMADCVLVTSKAYPTIFDMATESASLLGITPPNVFVRTDPVPNAYTYGAEYPFVIINSGLIDLLTDDELTTVVAHECGHIKAHHVLYLEVADFVTYSAAQLGLAALPLTALSLALREWERKSELTADRAAFLCTQNLGLVFSMLMKLAGGASRLYRHAGRQRRPRHGALGRQTHGGGHEPLVDRGAGLAWTTFPLMDGQFIPQVATEREAFHVAHRLLDKVCEVTERYLEAQVRAGAQAIQIFDSWAGLASRADWRALSLPYVQRVVARLRPTGVPLIYFGLNAAHLYEDIRETGVDVVGVDWRTELHEASRRLGPGFAVQGNLDPTVLLTTPERIAARARERRLYVEFDLVDRWVRQHGETEVRRAPVQIREHSRAETDEREHVRPRIRRIEDEEVVDAD